MVATRPIRARETTMTAIARQPRLLWNGRDRRREAEPVPAQVLEVVRPQRERVVSGNLGSAPLLVPTTSAPQNRLIWTNDNLVALTSLLHGDDEYAPLAGQVDLIYIDPPFAVQSNFTIKVEIEDGVADEKLPSLIEELAYRDTWENGLDSYLSMMRDRLELLKALLRPTGSIYVHCDWHAGHYLKVLMDEVFGYENFMSEVVWQRTHTHADAQGYGSMHDVLLFYAKDMDLVTWETPYRPHSREYLDSHYTQKDSTGRRYQLITATAPGHGRTHPPMRFGERLLAPPSGRMWAWTQENIDELWA